MPGHSHQIAGQIADFFVKRGGKIVKSGGNALRHVSVDEQVANRPSAELKELRRNQEVLASF